MFLYFQNIFSGFLLILSKELMVLDLYFSAIFFCSIKQSISFRSSSLFGSANATFHPINSSSEVTKRPLSRKTCISGKFHQSFCTLIAVHRLISTLLIQSIKWQRQTRDSFNNIYTNYTKIYLPAQLEFNHSLKHLSFLKERKILVK